MAELMVAEASGVAIYHRGRALIVVDRKTRWIYTAGFVIGLLSFVIGANGLVQIAMAMKGEGILWLGVVLTAIATLGGWLLSRLIARIRQRQRQPPEELTIVAILDLEGRMLRDPSGVPLSPLDSVRIGRKTQLGSSSPALTASWPGGSIVLARGNPFAGGVAPLEEALRASGLATGG